MIQFVEGPSEGGGVRPVQQLDSAGLGFCPDLQPDLSVGRAQDTLLVGAQDVAHDLSTLRRLGVTHIVNVAWGVPNTFPEVRYTTLSTDACSALPILIVVAVCERYPLKQCSSVHVRRTSAT